MVNNRTLAENPAVEHAVRNAIRVFRAALTEAMVGEQHYFGEIKMRFQFQDDKLTLIRSEHERTYQVRS